MKVNRILLGGLLFAAIVDLSGCATNYVPSAHPTDVDLVPNIPAGTRVALINTQPAVGSVLIGNAGMGRSVYGNLHAWTDQAIIAIKRTLEKKGVTVSDGSDKSLQVAITKAELGETGGGWAFGCTIHFTIVTSDGQLASMDAHDHSWKYFNACDGAISKVAAVALADDRIVRFLSAH